MALESCYRYENSNKGSGRVDELAPRTLCNCLSILFSQLKEGQSYRSLRKNSKVNFILLKENNKNSPNIQQNPQHVSICVLFFPLRFSLNERTALNILKVFPFPLQAPLSTFLVMKFACFLPPLWLKIGQFNNDKNSS